MALAILYRTTNKKNGKWYVGVHAQKGVGFDGYLGSGEALKRAFKKYGKENFERKVLCVGEIDYVYGLEEKYLLDKWKQQDNYNGMPGGIRGPSMLGKFNPRFGKERSEEVKQKLREANGGKGNYWYGKKRPEHAEKMRKVGLTRTHSEETKNKISRSQKERLRGRNPWNKGVPMTQEAKEKMRATKKANRLKPL
jgi:group I intron endonuclease